MTNLVDFLKARLDEDEQTARAAIGGPWFLEHRPALNAWDITGRNDPHHVARFEEIGGGDQTPQHIARWDPARVLAEVDAKRRIVAAAATACPLGCARDHTFSGSCTLRWMGPAWDEDGRRWAHDADGATVLAPPVTTSYVLRLLALPYRNHPDYQPEWAPEG